jgi:predicted dinucleotide-binding enzyme
MRMGMLGTGSVGQTLAGKLAELGHEVVVGTRDVAALMARTDAPYGGTAFPRWHADHADVRVGTFADAASHGEMVWNATSGGGSVEALRAAGAERLAGKVLVDVANPLDFSSGMPPSLTVCNTDSLGEQIQRAFPETRVVKTLNTVNAGVMVDPASVAGGDHHVFLSGDDEDAKAAVTEVLRAGFGWTQVIDLGGIATARGVEMYLPLVVGLFGVLGTSAVNVKVMW